MDGQRSRRRASRDGKGSQELIKIIIIILLKATIRHLLLYYHRQKEEVPYRYSPDILRMLMLCGNEWLCIGYFLYGGHSRLMLNAALCTL